LHTIFRSPDGSVKLIGEKETGEAFGIDLGKAPEPHAFPLAELNAIREDVFPRSFATDHNNRGIRKLEINPVYMAHALSIVSMCWQASGSTEAQRVDMAIPPHPRAPIIFGSQWPEKGPLFRAEYIIMPYTSP
jgi:hypothetical protein